MEEIKNNIVHIEGEINKGFEYSHEVFGESFFMSELKVARKSGVEDLIQICVSDRLLDVSQNLVGSAVVITGKFRSYNKHEEKRNRLILSVFVRGIEFVDCLYCDREANKIELVGFVCKPPVYRKTLQGREIADILLAVNRPYGKSDYIPCICWGRNAIRAESIPVGTSIEITGRIQSREYQKNFEDGTFETRTAYEVSVYKMVEMEDVHNEDE